MTKTRRRPAELIRRFPDPNSPGEYVTYLPAGAVTELVGISSTPLFRWPRAGHVRHTDRLNGSRNYTVVDVARLKLMTRKDLEEAGIRKVPEHDQKTGQPLVLIARALGRTYSAVCAQVARLHSSGDLPRRSTSRMMDGRNEPVLS